MRCQRCFFKYTLQIISHQDSPNPLDADRANKDREKHNVFQALLFHESTVLAIRPVHSHFHSPGLRIADIHRASFAFQVILLDPALLLTFCIFRWLNPTLNLVHQLHGLLRQIPGRLLQILSLAHLLESSFPKQPSRFKKSFQAIVQLTCPEYRPPHLRKLLPPRRVGVPIYPIERAIFGERFSLRGQFALKGGGGYEPRA